MTEQKNAFDVALTPDAVAAVTTECILETANRVKP